MSALGSLVVKLALEYAEYTKGLDKSSQESLAFAKKTQKHFDDAATSAKAFFADAAKGMLGYLGASTALDAFNVSLEKLATLDDMAQKTGSSVENLSRLQKVAEMTAFEFGNVDAGVLKLARGMGGLDEEGNKVVNALAAIDVQTKNSDGSLRDSSEVLVDVAKKLQNYKDDSAKAALATDLFGKSGADLLPYLNDVAEKVDGVSSYSTEAATNAARLQDNFSALKTRAGELSTEMSVLAMPVVLEVFKSLTVLGAEVAYVFKAVGTEIGGIAAQAAALATGDFSGAKKIGEMMKADAITAREELDKWSAGIMKIGTESEKTGEVVKESLGKTVAALNQTKEDELKLEAERKRIEDEKKKRNEQALQQQQQIIKSQNAFILSLEKETITLSMSAAQSKIYAAQQLGIKGAQLEKVKALTGSIESHKAHEKALADDFKATQDYFTKKQDVAKAISQETASLNTQIAAQREYNSRIGLSTEALQQLLDGEVERQALRLESIATDNAMLDRLGGTSQAYREQANALRELNSLKKEGAAKQFAVDQVNQSLREQADMWASIDRTAHDTFISMWDSSKETAQRLKDTFKNVFFDWLYQMTVKKWIVNLSAGVTMTASGSALASTGGVESMLNPSNMISAGQSLWQGFTAAGTLGNGFWGSVAGGLQGAGAGSGLTSAMGLDIGNYLQGVLGNNVAGSLSSGISSISAAMPYAAAAIAAFQISKGINGGYRLGGLSADAGALLGVAPRLFGMQEKELGAQTITGTLGSNDLARNVAWSQKGGLFRSDRSGTWSYNLANSTAIQDGKAYQDTASLASDQALLQQLNGTYDAMKTAATDYAKALGLNASAIEQKADQINLTLSKSAEENQAAIQKTFAAIADSYASMLLPSISSLSQQGETAANTLARLATNFQTVNQGFDALGLKMFEIGEEGIKASEKFTAAVGGLQSFQAAQASFYQNFYSEEERNNELKKQLTAELQKQNLALPESRKGYRALLEEVSKTGTPEQLASLFKLNAAFASVFGEVDAAADLAATQLDQQVLSQQRLSAAAISATQAIEQQVLATAALERATAQKAYDDALQGRLRSGNVGEIMASNYALNPVDMLSYVGGGQFDAAGFNSEIIRQRAKLAIDLANQASADAINVEDITGVLASLFEFTKDREFENELRKSLPANARNQVSETVGYVFSDFIDASIAGIRLNQWTSRGKGITSVIAAQEDLQFQRDLQTGYSRSLSSANAMLHLGIITQEQYQSALSDANEILADNVRSQESLNDALRQAGIDSVSFYFDQIGKSVEALNAAAIEAQEPLAQVNASIGRLKSIGDVLSLSASAAGGDAKADLVAKSAALAASALTTQSAAQIAKELAAKESFAGIDDPQLRNLSMLIEGVKSFDAGSFEAGFLRISDALNKGMINESQYQDLFDQSLSTFNGADQEVKALSDSMTKLRDSMSSFADGLMVDKQRTALSSIESFAALQSQYDTAKMLAATGDSAAVSRFQSLATQLLDRDDYKTRGDYNAQFSRVLGDARYLETIGARSVQNDGQNIVDELVKMNTDLTKELTKLREEMRVSMGAIANNTSKTASGVGTLVTQG